MLGETLKAQSDYLPPNTVDYGRLFILSLGTGSSKNEMKYDAKMAAKWGVLDWIYTSGSSPLIDSFTQAAQDMVDIHVNTTFEAIHCQQNYLRIQVRRLLYHIPMISSYLLLNKFFLYVACLLSMA